MKNKISVVVLGATGAVGGSVLKALLSFQEVEKITLLGRRPVGDITDPSVFQNKADIFDPDSYLKYTQGHSHAICTLGVGEPSKMSRSDFEKIDKLAVLDFAKVCKAAGVHHFELLSSVGISHSSNNYFLRTKGALVEALKLLHFERLSVFKPSMILTPQNRYGIAQGITLAVWPLLKPILLGGLRKYRGVKVEVLGTAITRNLFTDGNGYEALTWDDFEKLTNI